MRTHERRVILAYSNIDRPKLHKFKAVHKRFNTKRTTLKLQYNPETQELFVNITIQATITQAKEIFHNIINALPSSNYTLEYLEDYRRNPTCLR
jgi:hypothetical protein